MLDTDLMKHLQSEGYRTPEDVTHLFIGGSELYGAKVGTTDDLDLCGVFIEQPEALGLNSRPLLIYKLIASVHREYWAKNDPPSRNTPLDYPA